LTALMSSSFASLATSTLTSRPLLPCTTRPRPPHSWRGQWPLSAHVIVREIGCQLAEGRGGVDVGGSHLPDEARGEEVGRKVTANVAAPSMREKGWWLTER
jgi:hypothetical protein